MANVEKIDSIVDSGVNKQITDLKDGLLGLNTTMISVLDSTAKMYAEIGKIDAIKQVVAANNQYTESTKKLKEIEAQYLAQSEKLRLAEEKLANQRQGSGTSKLSAYEKELNAQRNASEKQTARIRIAEEQLNSIMQRQAATSAEAIAQNKQLRAAILNLNPAWESEKQKIEQINAVINRNDDLITANGDNMVKQKRNIGNYASGFSPLNNAMAQLTREGPAFANSMTTGFMAISNNLPILADAIQQVKMQNAALRAEGQPTTSVFKQIVSSLFSWQTALSLGVVLLTVYGKEMVNWIASLFESEKALNANTIATNQLNSARLKGAQSAQDELVTLRLLYQATQNENVSKENKLKAVKELQKEYPSYFGNLSTEQILAGKAASAYINLTNSILASAKARAVEDKIIENSKKLLELNGQIASTQAELNFAYKNTNASLANDPNLVIQSGNVRLYNENTEKLKNITKERERLIAVNKKLAENINVSDLIVNTKEKPTYPRPWVKPVVVETRPDAREILQRAKDGDLEWQNKPTPM